MLRVSIRVAGEIKACYTYVKLVEDVTAATRGRARIVEAGFLDYRVVPVSIDLPPPEMDTVDRQLHCELAAADLRGALEAFLGHDPRMLSGRLFVVVDTDPPPHEAAEPLRVLGYRVDVLQ